MRFAIFTGVIGGTLALVGCTSTQEIRIKSPVATYTSAKTILALEECLMDDVRAEYTMWGPGRQVRGEGRTAIEWGHGLNVRLLVTLTQGPPTKVEVRVSKTYPEALKRVVAACI